MLYEASFSRSVPGHQGGAEMTSAGRHICMHGSCHGAYLDLLSLHSSKKKSLAININYIKGICGFDMFSYILYILYIHT